MRHAHTEHTPQPGTPDNEFDPWLDAFASAEAYDELDRQVFAIRESLADFRSLQEGGTP